MLPPLIIANWKMQISPLRSVELAKEILKKKKREKSTIVLCPSTPALSGVHEVIKKQKNFFIGAQDVFYEERGAYTGEVSVEMIQDTCTYSIVGHSEQRYYGGDTDERIQKKIAILTRHGLAPILCVGETKSERRWGRGAAVVKRQLRAALHGCNRAPAGLVIAYEPIWAIGTGTSAVKEAAAMRRVIHRTLFKVLPKNLHGKTRVIYGGSVDPKNVADYVGPEKMEGALVGGASLKADSFWSIVRSAEL